MPDNVIYLSLDFLGYVFIKSVGEINPVVSLFSLIFRDSQFFGQFIHIRKLDKKGYTIIFLSLNISFASEAFWDREEIKASTHKKMRSYLPSQLVIGIEYLRRKFTD